MIDEIRKLRELTETLTGHGYLRDKAEEWEFVLDSLPDAIYIVNTNYEIKFINRVLKKKMNLRHKTDIYDKVCYNVIEGLPNPMENPPSTSESSTLPDLYVESLGGWYSLIRSPIITDTNKLLGFIVILKDVTEKRRAEFSSQARQQMLETIYRASPIGIGVVSKEDRVLKFVNHAISDMVQMPEDKLVNQNARILYPSDKEYERVGTEKHAKVDYQKVASIETKWRRVDGKILDVFLSSSRVPGSTDVVFTVMDITKVKENERILKRNEERLEALLELTKMSHLDEEALTQYALEEAVRLTDSKIGYLHFVEDEGLEEGINLNLFTWTDAVKKVCKAEKTAHYPLHAAGIWADSVRTKEPVIHNDYPGMGRSDKLPEGHINVTRHMCVPVFDGDRVIAVAGVGNKELPYNQTDSYQLSVFMKSMWEILTRKQAEKAAEESRESLERLINTSPMGVFVYKVIDNDLILTHFNEAAQKSLGMKAGPHMGKKMEDIFPDLAKTKVPAIYKKLALEGGIYRKNNFKYDDDVANVHGIFTIFAFQSADGEVAVFFADVTKQAQAQDAIAKSEERFRTAFMTIPDPAIILEYGTGKLVAVNPVTCRLSGYSEEELVGKDLLTVNLWESIYDRETFYKILDDTGSVENFPAKVRLKNGELREVVFNSRLFDLEEKPHVITILKDISTIIHMREDICAREDMYQGILDRVQDGVFLIQDKDLVLINKPLNNMLGYEEGELQGKPLKEIIAPKSYDSVMGNYRKRVSGKMAPSMYNAFLLTKDGEEIEVIIDANAVIYNGRMGSMGTVNKV